MSQLTLAGFSRKFKKFIGVNNAPFENSGYIFRNEQKDFVNKIAVTLDLSVDAIKEALKLQADILLCFHAPDSLDQAEKDEREIMQLARGRVSIFKCHLPLNFSRKGLHQKMCSILGIRAAPITFKYGGKFVRGGFYRCSGPHSIKSLLPRLAKLEGRYVRVYNSKEKGHLYRNILISSGSGFKKEIMGQVPCEMIISGEIKHGSVIKAKDLGITLVEVGHYASENKPLKFVARELQKQLGIKVVFIAGQFREDIYEFK